MNIYEITLEQGKEYLDRKGVQLKAGNEKEFEPQWDDLARLFFLIRERRPETVLEFGSGWSTVVIGEALMQNGKGNLTSIETSFKWADVTRSKVNNLPVNIVITHAEVGLYDQQVCHFYYSLPDITPDFIYLDGPDPADVQGNVNGLTFRPGRTVMAADPLLYESTLLPGFFMLIDGRGNNGRFLQRNLKRNYIIQYHPQADVTTFELDEVGLRGINNPLMPETAKN